MATKIVRVADLRQQVYETLKTQITNGTYPSDTKFQEISLAQHLGVSRTPVREALAMLVRDGILVQMTRGFRFPRFTPEEIDEIIEIRQLIEPHAIETMIRQNTPTAMRALARRVRSEILDAGDTDAYAEAHRKVRTDIYSHVRNRQLVEAIARYEDSIHYMRTRTLRDRRMRKISIDGMLKLADAIEEGDAEGARAIMHQQITNAREAFLECAAKDQADSVE